jgi:hypothetical protein
VEQNAKYRMIRVRADTHARLSAIRCRLFAAYREGRLPLPDSQAEHLSMDFVLNHLAGQLEAHGRRRAKARRKS